VETVKISPLHVAHSNQRGVDLVFYRHEVTKHGVQQTAIISLD